VFILGVAQVVDALGNPLCLSGDSRFYGSSVFASLRRLPTRFVRLAYSLLALGIRDLVDVAD